MFAPNSSHEQRNRLSSSNLTILKEVVSDAPLEGMNRKTMKKTFFPLFGDSIHEFDDCLYDGEYKATLKR